MTKFKQAFSLLTGAFFGLGVAGGILSIVIRLAPRDARSDLTMIGLMSVGGALAVGFPVGIWIWATLATRLRLLTWREIEQLMGIAGVGDS